MKKSVLLIEDMPDMQMIVDAAIGAVCELRCVATLAEGERELSSGQYSLLILDGHLPDGDGFEYLRSLKGKDAFRDLPVILLTSRTEIENRVLGFELGAEDYITKPLEPTEFCARVTSKLRRVTTAAKPQAAFVGSGFRLDLSSQKAFEIADGGGEKALALTPIEFKLFSNFVQNVEKVFSRPELLSLLWGGDVHVSDHTVDTHISTLRKKLGPSGPRIQSVFKKGYRFI